MQETGLSARSVSPLYVQLMEQIRLDIQRGVYPVGDRIPTEHELETRYGVSRVTVRRALQELTSAGMLERKQGKGTFVTQPKNQTAARGVQGFHEACREMGKNPSVSSVRVMEISSTPEDRIRLNLAPEARVLEIRRTLLADGEPVVLEKLHFSMAYVWLENANLRGSLYQLLQEYGIQPEKSTYDLSLRNASREEAEQLMIPEGTALLAEDQVVYDQRGRALHTSRRLIRGEKIILRI